MTSSNISKESQDNLPAGTPECPVCLQMCSQPVSLPCSHVFCFLCAKGIASHSRRCALCREAIPEGYLNSPNIVEDNTPTLAIEGKYQWFYQGTNGWWQYETRTGNEIEASFQEGKTSLKIMISGFIYIVDIERMIQYRENIPSRVRHIKRDLTNIPNKKGIAGVPFKKPLEAEGSGLSMSSTSREINSQTSTEHIAETTDHTSKETKDVDELLNGDMSRLKLDEKENDKDNDDRTIDGASNIL